VSSLEHITVTTGATRLSPRSEVRDDIVNKVRKSLAEANGRLPGRWQVKMLPTPEGGYVFDLMLAKSHIARCWLCADNLAFDGLWGAASSSGLDPHAVIRPPTHTPWLAAALTTGGIMLAMTEPEALAEAGDLERCVAWALLE